MTITSQVRQYLSDNEKARNSDKYLIALFLRDSDLDLTKEQIQKLLAFPSFESIRRTRQIIQANGEYPATNTVRGERNRKAQEIQQNAPTAKPERIEQILEDGRKITVPAGYRIVEEL